MSNNLILIKALLNNTIYNKYNLYIEPLLKNNKELYGLYNYLAKLHSKYERDISFTELSLYILVNCPEGLKETYSLLLKEIGSVDVDNSILDDILSDMTNKQRAYDLALAALEVTEGKKEFTDLLVLAGDLNATERPTKAFLDTFVTNDLEELYDHTEQRPGLRWRLSWLNESLGSLRKGDFGFLFARPESGKTTFLASECTNFAEQIHNRLLGEGIQAPILWFNNEQGGDLVQLRIYQAMLGTTLTELYANRPQNNHLFKTMGGELIKLYDSAVIHRKQVEFMCKNLQPSLVIFDQLDKIKGFTDDREDLRLGAIYIWARELAKEYCPVIGVCQADASGEGKKFLTMENVANAKTAKQAEADWILGIGADHSEVNQYLRYLNICKNKLLGDTDSRPELRHGRTTVKIIPEIARYAPV